MNKEFALSIRIEDFAEAFGTSPEEIVRFCDGLIKDADFSYRNCSPDEKKKIFADITGKCGTGAFPVSGPHRQPDWSKGWKEILEEFLRSGKKLDALTPKDIRGGQPLRYKGNYIISGSGTFERDYWLIFKNWLFRKYFPGYANIYEFGCGTGHNLVLLAEIFPDKNFFGMDWAPESQKILEAIAEKYGWKIKASRFDFFAPDHKLEILPGSLVYTSAALEQLGSDYNKFLDYLFAKKPALCVNVECLAEYYNESDEFDRIALKYHKTRGYLEGFLTRLRGLEKSGKIQIIAEKRLGFGSLYHEVFNYVIWKII